jgi:hypothetical protein
MMINLLKRFVNLLSIIGTGIGVLMLTVPLLSGAGTGPKLIEVVSGMIAGYIFITGLNYLLFSRPVIWNKGV